MIEKVRVKGKMKKDKAEKKQVWNKTGSVYDDATEEFSFDMNEATGTGFRLVHDGKTTFAIIKGTEKSITHCVHNIEEFETEQECLDRIKELGLEYTEVEILK